MSTSMGSIPIRQIVITNKGSIIVNGSKCLSLPGTRLINGRVQMTTKLKGINFITTYGV